MLRYIFLYPTRNIFLGFLYAFRISSVNVMSRVGFNHCLIISSVTNTFILWVNLCIIFFPVSFIFFFRGTLSKAFSRFINLALTFILWFCGFLVVCFIDYIYIFLFWARTALRLMLFFSFIFFSTMCSEIFNFLKSLCKCCSLFCFLFSSLILLMLPANFAGFHAPFK